MALFGLIPDKKEQPVVTPGINPGADQQQALLIELDRQHRRKGILDQLGVGGRTRDILGTIGDALLVGSGNRPLYRPRKDQELMADALQNFTDDPIEAIKRLNAAGFPDQAREMYDRYLAQTNASMTKQAQAQDARDKRWSIVTRMLNPKVVTEANYPMIRKQALDYLKASGTDPLYDIPETYDPDVIANLFMSGIPTEKQYSEQMDADYRNKRLAQFDADIANRVRNTDSLVEDRPLRRALTERGQNMTAATAQRGQDIRANTAAEGQKVTAEGNRLRAATATRGQDLQQERYERGLQGNLGKKGATATSKEAKKDSTGSAPPFEPAFEGQIVRNKTGNRWIARNGKWAPLKN